MNITIETPIYNEKRYGKPYIGKVNPADGKVSAWGTWIGTPGCRGILEIDAEPGDMIVEGQKDNRGNNGTPNYGIVQADGTIEYMGKAEAVKAAREHAAQRLRPAAEPTLADILAALGVSTTTAALARIAELQAD